MIPNILDDIFFFGFTIWYSKFSRPIYSDSLQTKSLFILKAQIETSD